MEQQIRIRKPDDWHVHLRDGNVLAAVAPFTARWFGRALIMPNLIPPITTAKAAIEYRDRIIKAVPHDSAFMPLMTCYLTDNVSPRELQYGFEERAFVAAKLYPVGATTNSQSGVTSTKKIHRALAVMQKIGMPLCIHGETVVRNGTRVDPYDREKVFLEEELVPLRRDFPDLRIVLEHVTTKEGVAYVEAEGGDRLAATVTAHHLWASRTDVFEGGMSPDLHCLPVIKRDEDRQALRRAVTSGNAHFFLGTDSAPHLENKKRAHRAPGGIFTAHAAIELYAQIFSDEGKIKHLEAFASLNGSRFYGLPPNETVISLQRTEWTVDDRIEVPNTGSSLWPFLFEENAEDRQPLQWRLR